MCGPPPAVAISVLVHAQNDDAPQPKKTSKKTLDKCVRARPACAVEGASLGIRHPASPCCLHSPPPRPRRTRCYLSTERLGRHPAIIALKDEVAELKERLA